MERPIKRSLFSASRGPGPSLAWLGIAAAILLVAGGLTATVIARATSAPSVTVAISENTPATADQRQLSAKEQQAAAEEGEYQEETQRQKRRTLHWIFRSVRQFLRLLD